MLSAQSATEVYIRAEGDFHKGIYIVERTNKAESRPEEPSEETYSYRENLWNEIQLKVPERQEQTQEQNKKEWAISVGLCQA